MENHICKNNHTYNTSILLESKTDSSDTHPQWIARLRAIIMANAAVSFNLPFPFARSSAFFLIHSVKSSSLILFLFSISVLSFQFFPFAITLAFTIPYNVIVKNLCYQFALFDFVSYNADIFLEFSLSALRIPRCGSFKFH